MLHRDSRRLWLCASLPVSIGSQLVAAPALAQQTADATFHFTNASPAYRAGQGPRVCMDLAHNDFQSSGRNPGSYAPLVELLEKDGYRVQESQSNFTTESLRQCNVLIVVDATASANTATWWARPHVSALTPDEIGAVDRWIRDGGGLFLIADHTPAPGAVRELGDRLGIVVLDGFAHLRADTSLDVFARQRREVADHPITRGRKATERVDSVATFTGHAFLASREWSPLLTFGAGSTGYIPYPDLPRPEWPRFAISGWFQGAARRLGAGRVVWLGEASVCTALQDKLGMNHPAARQNAQFCLSITRWLTRALDP
jgi:hypothetical protein